MAPLPPENTARYKVFYTVAGHQHTQTWRVDPPPSPATFEGFLVSVWAAIEPDLFPYVINDVQFAASGINVFNSVVMPTFTGSVGGSGAPLNVDVPRFINFVGRSTDGRRVREAWFGWKVSENTFRYNAGESANVDATLAVIVGATPPLCTISGLTPVWKAYANYGDNAYWQRAVRS